MMEGTWNPAWLEASIQAIFQPVVWRGVENQRLSSTNCLVDSLQEHDVLEMLLEGSKPKMPEQEKHFLLSTPFRYAPAHPSRFRRSGQSGHWYGARELKTACAEVAYWRMQFMLDSAGLRNEKIVTHHTFFPAVVNGQGIDLMNEPWLACRSLWVGNDYAHTHELADAAKQSGVELICYESTRAPGHACFVVFELRALKEPKRGLDNCSQQWVCTATIDHVMMWSISNMLLDRYEFER